MRFKDCKKNGMATHFSDELYKCNDKACPKRVSYQGIFFCQEPIIDKLVDNKIREAIK